MTKSPIELRADDLTIFARTLSRQLGAESPSHLTLMNMLARAAGFQNLQHMRSATSAARRLAKRTLDPAIDARLVERTLNQFDKSGRLHQWPSKRAVQTLARWAQWATLDAHRSYDERALNDHLLDEHCFQDPATLRRTMISCGLLTRKTDGTEYRRVEQEPPAEAKAVIHAISAKRRMRLASKTRNIDPSEARPMSQAVSKVM